MRRSYCTDLACYLGKKNGPLFGEAGMPGPMGIGPFERLKPDAGRLASPVLRGRGIGNGLLLPDYLSEYESVREARSGIHGYLRFYNEERLHQSLNYKTPRKIYLGKLS